MKILARSALLAALALLLCGPAVRAGEIRTSSEWKKLKREIQEDLYSKFKDKRFEAVRRLGEANYIKAVQTLVSLLERENPRLAILERKVRENLREIQRLTKLAQNQGNRLHVDDIQKLKTLRAELREINRQMLRENDVRDLVVWGLARTTDEASLRWLRSRWSKGGRTALALLEAFGFMRFPGVEDELAEAARHDDPQMRVAALQSLGRHDLRKAWDAMLAALDDDFWQVRSTAVAWMAAQTTASEPFGRPVLGAVRMVLGRRAGLAVVDRLIDALGRETGRLRGDIDDLLRRIVGRSFQGDHDLWKSWWAANRKEVLAGGAGQEHGAARGALRTVSFYGIRSLSKNILFIIDVSGSMEWKSPVAPGKEEGEAAPAQDPNLPVGTGPEDDRKISIAKWELKRAIGQLSEDARFNIIYYNHEVKLFAPKMMAASLPMKKRAFAFIDGVKAEGGTNIYDSLVRAFTLGGGERNDKKNFENSVDTIFFLSDGVPTQGKITDIPLILKDIRERNKVRRIIIHAVGLSTKSDKPEEQSKLDEFVRKLAEQNGGRYVKR